MSSRLCSLKAPKAVGEDPFFSSSSLWRHLAPHSIPWFVAESPQALAHLYMAFFSPLLLFLFSSYKEKPLD